MLYAKMQEEAFSKRICIAECELIGTTIRNPARFLSDGLHLYSFHYDWYLYLGK